MTHEEGGSEECEEMSEGDEELLLLLETEELWLWEPLEETEE